jgi:hypothetical protein
MFVNNSKKKDKIGSPCLERCFRKLKTNANLEKEKLEESRIDRELLEGDCSEVLSEKKKLERDILERHKKDRKNFLYDIDRASEIVDYTRERILRQERILQQMKSNFLLMNSTWKYLKRKQKRMKRRSK